MPMELEGVLLHRSGVDSWRTLCAGHALHLIRRSEFRFDAYDPPQPVGMEPESTTPRGCTSAVANHANSGHHYLTQVRCAATINWRSGPQTTWAVGTSSRVCA